MELLIRFVVFVTLLSGCYSPSLDGKFTCAADGSCPPGLRCGGDHVCRDEVVDGGAVEDLATKADAATCPKKTCTGQMCGDLDDGCGGKLSCGMCTGVAKMCGGSGANLCGITMCMPKSCKTQNADCGQLSDGCSMLLNCGACEDDKSCGTDHKCH